MNDIDTSNTINGAPIYYLTEKNNHTFENIEIGFLGLISCENITVKNCVLKNNGQGLLIVNSTNLTIRENRIFYNREGIFVNSSSNLSIISNHIYNNFAGGITLKQTSGAEVHCCNIYNNSRGIHNEQTEAFYQANATLNWWNESEPNTSANVINDPWLIEPYPLSVNVTQPICEFTNKDVKLIYTIHPFTSLGEPIKVTITGPANNTLYTQECEYQLSITINDEFGNSATKNVSFIIDKTAPTTTHAVTGTIGANNWYVSDVTISLCGLDALSGIACTYYQINEGDTQTGTFLSLTQSGTYTIKYWSVDNAGNREQDPSVIIKIDKGKPIVTLNSPANNEILVTNTPTLSWSGSDDASAVSYYEVQVDTNNNFASPEFFTTTTATQVTTNALIDNTYYWRVRAADNAGNIGDWQQRSFTINTGPPTNLSIKINNDALLTNSTQVTLVLSASANAYEMCFSNDNLSWSEWEAFTNTKSWALSAGADGERTVYFKCRSVSGNESEVASDTIILDTTVPDLAITKPQNSTITNKENITVEGSVRDLNGIEKAEILVNDTPYLLTIADDNFTQVVKLSNGTNTIRLRAKDNAGNWAEKAITVIYDPTLPVLIIYTPANNSITNNSQCLVSGKTEPEYTVKVNGNQISLNSEGEFSTIIALLEGLNIINVTATNFAGTATTIFLHVILDTVPPGAPQSLTITPSEWTNVNSFTIDWNNPSDNSGVAGAWYKIGLVPQSGNDGIFTANKPFTFSSNPGSKAIYVWLQDNAGNANHELYAIVYAKYDPYSPSTTMLVFGIEGQRGWHLSDVQVELSSTDNLSLVKEVWYNYDNSGWQKYVSKINITSSGSHKIELYSIDNAGNQEAIQTKYVKIDKDSPYSNLTAVGVAGAPEWFVGDVEIFIEGHDDTSGVYATLY
ncbi:MAG: right-handed parallel beta-helix repeat-containing protein, partial [Candidatus Thermoplasmatota archaeon]